LPLHAAGLYDGPNAECCSDYVVSSYTPTISALQRARKDCTDLPRDALKLVLVAESSAPNVDPLPQVDEEVQCISRIAEVQSAKVTTIQTPATSNDVIKTIKTANIVHMACHGIQNRSNALKSGFCLHDGDLTVSRLMRLKLERPLLAFLSACETARGDSRQPDQIIHLAAAMLFGGFQSVVATMWWVKLRPNPCLK
jgi:CHAT domain-containing protein